MINQIVQPNCFNPQFSADDHSPYGVEVNEAEVPPHLVDRAPGWEVTSVGSGDSKWDPVMVSNEAANDGSTMAQLGQY